MRTAVVFPGQGSQRPAMGRRWLDTPVWSLVAEAEQAVGAELAPLLLTADAETLRATANAQLSTCLASLLAWRACGLEPVVVAGHSLGELTALIAAEAVTLADGLALVAARGAAMQRAADQRPGTMAAVLGLPPQRVAEVCDAVGEVWPANDNAPLHVVVSGTVPGVAAAGEALRAAGARRVLPLPVGGAFHTPLMAPARQALLAAAREASWHPAVVPVLSAVDLQPYGDDPPARVARQLTAVVRWRELCGALSAHGVERVVEVGPGGVLAGLVRRCLPGVEVTAVASPEDVAALRP